MIEIFKITHGFYDNLVTESFLNLRENKVNTRGHTYKIDKKGCRLNIRLNSFRFRTVDQWNSLPKHVVEAKTIACFESRLDKLWNGSGVMYDPNIDQLRHETKNRNIRRSAQPDTDVDYDLTTEA